MFYFEMMRRKAINDKVVINIEIAPLTISQIGMFVSIGHFSKCVEPFKNVVPIKHLINL
jgi:hypothetical protein